MKAKLEKKVLEELSEILDNKPKVVKKYKIISAVLTYVPAIILGILLGTGKNIHFIYGVILGFPIGLSILYKSSADQVPFFSKHLNKESIEERLKEIKNTP